MSTAEASQPRKAPGRRAVGIALAVIAGVLLVARRVAVDPGVVLLLPVSGAEWVRVDRPFGLSMRMDTVAAAADFEATGTAERPPVDAELSVTALRQVTATVDDVPLAEVGPPPASWKAARRFRLPTGLAAGPHRLRLSVTDRDGPPLVRAVCPDLGLLTGHGPWRARSDNGPWAAAVPAARPWRPALSDEFGPSWLALARASPLVIMPFGIASVLALRQPSGGFDWGRRARWAVLAAWVVMGASEIGRLPLEVGYDAFDHYRFGRYVVDHNGRLPPPDAGLQFFQAPLYYWLPAALWKGLAACGVAATRLPYLIRLVPLGCGAGLAELSYRAARHAFPGRPGLHAVGVVVGGLVPVNLYMGLSVSNEPLAGLLGGGVAVVGIRLLSRPADPHRPRWLVGAGAMLGLAILAKVSMALWAVPLAVAVVVSRSRTPGRSPWRGVLAVWATAAAVCGPYLTRTWRVTGRPVIAHGTLGGHPWWQDPGFRTPRQLLTFGPGLTRVVYGGVDSVWDSLYSTVWANGFLTGMVDTEHQLPWHLDAMAAGLWLAIVPMALLAIGAVAGRPRGGRAFPAAAIAVFVAAVLWVYLTLPIYSCGKGSYLLSTLPCAAVLAAAGADRLVVGRRSRAVLIGLLAAWAVPSYLTYVSFG